MKKKIIIIVVLILGAAAAGVWYFTKPPEAPKTIFYSPGDSFVTNIKDSKSMLKTTIVLALNQEGMEEHLKENNDVIRDVIVFTLRKKTEEELRSPNIENELREEIVTNLKKTLDAKYITSIYFNEYIVQ